MIKQILTGMILAAGLAVTASAADIVIRVGPPRNQVERRSVSPGRGYVWQPGYRVWTGYRYRWVPGAWVRAPYPRGAYRERVYRDWDHRGWDRGRNDDRRDWRYDRDYRR